MPAVVYLQRNLRRDKDRRNLTQFNLQTLPKSAKQKERDRMRLQKKFQKQFGVRQKWDQKSQVLSAPIGFSHVFQLLSSTLNKLKQV